MPLSQNAALRWLSSRLPIRYLVVQRSLAPAMLLSALLFLLITLDEVTSCGQRRARRGRIVGGDVTSPGEHPWVLAVTVHGSHKCGATILSERWLLTAAHCLLNFRRQDYSILSQQQPNRKWAVDKALLHPGFALTGAGAHDIALLRLASRLPFPQAICLPTDGTDFTNKMATVLGWGATSESVLQYSPFLRHVRVPVVSTEQCRQWMVKAGRPDVALALREGHLCAGYAAGGRDACVGDSGGPLVVRDGHSKRFVVIGVASAGIGCARALLPGIYTSVLPYLPWITSVIHEARNSSATK